MTAGGELSLGEKVVANDRASKYNDYIVTATEQVCCFFYLLQLKFKFDLLVV